MPATEQTWRNQKVMHVVFGVSALIMAIATLWLLAKDHNREWKQWQLKDRRKESWNLQASHDALQIQVAAQQASFTAEKAVAESVSIDANLIDQFADLVEAEDRRLAPQAASAPTDQFDAVRKLRDELDAKNREIAEAETSGNDAQANIATLRKIALKLRTKITSALGSHIDEAKRREKRLVGEKKTINGMRTAVVSELGLMVHGDADQTALDRTQLKIDGYDEQLRELTAGIAEALEYRTSLERITATIDARRDELVKLLAANEAELARLKEQVSKNTSNVGEWITRWPVLNALYDGNVKIVQNWLPDLTINYNFSQVARFDRCATCHRGIAKTLPGTATDPLYPTLPREQRELTIRLAKPTEPPAEGATLRDVYGMELVDEGMVSDAEVTVHFVLPNTPAARAGLRSGDVLLSVDEAQAHTPQAVSELLLSLPNASSEAILSVHRGLDHPFTAHPRLDLYLTDLSPHPEKVVGCTICHDGQGSGTDFKWASHTPNNADQQISWSREHGWFDNHHWIFPMKPARFAESNCLKCHHQKGGLEPSAKFPEPPAPKVTEGWTVVEQYGCFGCHEVKGFSGPGKTIGPDVRLEPNFHEAAAAILEDPGLTDHQRDLARQIVAMPSSDAARHELLASIDADAALAAQTVANASPVLADATHKVANVLKDIETPGSYRKAGPSLRYLDAKVDFDWLYSWIRRPEDFRPSTKMPKFFGNWEHLSDPEDQESLHASMKFEPLEIRALSTFLLKNSRPFENATPAEGITETASAERGKWLFESRGCLGCHSHSQFSGIAQDKGPDLSQVAAKFRGAKGKAWLYTWLKEPHKYHPRTSMPDLYLDPIAVTDPQGKPTGKVTDPAADLVEYLLGVPTDWRANDVPAGTVAAFTEREKQALADLALEWLASDAIPKERAKQYLRDGIPERLAPRLKVDERLLLGINDENRTERHLDYVARRTISKYGCYGCHDIPGFEDAKPIGTALLDWGRKETSKLAFENIQTFLSKHGLHPKSPTAENAHVSTDGHDVTVGNQAAGGHLVAGDHAAGDHGAGDHGDEHASHGHLDPSDSRFSDDESYFVQSLNSHSRDGFLWQKLRYPRSYDYKTTKNKGFNDRLRMPKFNFTDAQREAVMTFVLGLVNEAPADKFVYKPSARQQAIVDGRQVLDKFNCSGCHTLKMEQWELAYDADAFSTATQVADYPFLAPQFSPKQLSDSLKTDARGLMRATLHGMPVLNDVTGQPTWVDEDRTPITPEELAEYEREEGTQIPVFYAFTPWENTVLNGEARLRGVEEFMIPAAREGYGPAHGTAYPAWGGELSRYLFNKVVARARQANPQVNAKEAWGWLAPPLMDEGAKVQTDWLHSFLMDPTPIRPAAVMRMPNFHMSSDDAAKLVNFFAATSGVDYPYEYKPQQRSSYLATMAHDGADPLADAMNIVVNGNYCVKCHGVADFMPQGDKNAFGPNLADVYRRLRPEYVRNWIANPARILPYTGMPVNIPYRAGEPHLGGVSQQLYKGDALAQLDGLVTLLMNFDAYAKRQTEVSGLVQKAAADAKAAAPAASNKKKADDEGQNAELENRSDESDKQAAR